MARASRAVSLGAVVVFRAIFPGRRILRTREFAGSAAYRHRIILKRSASRIVAAFLDVGEGWPRGKEYAVQIVKPVAVASIGSVPRQRVSHGCRSIAVSLCAVL